LRDQLVSLLQLQLADIKVRELETAANQLPAKLDPLRRDLAKLESMLDAERAKLAETEAWRKQQQELIEREREALKAAQAKLQASKNSKEFSAASREVENKRKSINDRESELRKVSEAANASKAQLEARDKDVETVRAELAKSEAAQAEQLTELKTQLAEAVASRDAARGKVDAQWLKTYDALAARKGFAVAPVIKGVCQGCHMTLPPQLNNILARMESIETCPRCNRLIYRKELLEPPAEAKPEESAGSAGGAATDAPKA
jgi:predicted  nucleic acid-binding Zn-ribbon protein